MNSGKIGLAFVVVVSIILGIIFWKKSDKPKKKTNTNTNTCDSQPQTQTGYTNTNTNTGPLTCDLANQTLNDDQDGCVCVENFSFDEEDVCQEIVIVDGNMENNYYFQNAVKTDYEDVESVEACRALALDDGSNAFTYKLSGAITPEQCSTFTLGNYNNGTLGTGVVTLVSGCTNINRKLSDTCVDAVIHEETWCADTG